MERKWYRAPFIKGVLLVLAHISAVVAVLGFTWVILCAGVNFINPAANIPKSYNETRQFSINMSDAMYNATEGMLHSENLAKNGKLDESKLINIEKYYNSQDISYKEGEGNGFVYTLNDLVNSKTDGRDHAIIVCQKIDGSYAYEEWESIRGKLLSGELVFAELADEQESPESEGEVNNNLENFLYYLENRYSGYENSEYFGICDKNGTLLYTDCWRMPESEILDILLSTKTAEGKEFLDLINEEPYWNGRLTEMEDMFQSVRGSINEEVDYYLQYEKNWTEGKTNLAFLIIDENAKKVYTNVSKYKDFNTAEEKYQELMKNKEGRENAYVYMDYETRETEVQNAGKWKASEWLSIGEHLNYNLGTENFKFIAAVDLDYPVMDHFQYVDEAYGKIQPYLHNMAVAAWVSVVVFLICVIWLTAVSGRSNMQDGVKLNIVDRLFTEIPAGTLVCGIGMIIGGVAVSYGEWYNNYGNWIIDGNGFSYYSAVTPVVGIQEFILIALMVLGGAICSFYGYLSCVRKLKAGTFFSGLGVWRIGRWCVRVLVKICRAAVNSIASFWRHRNLLTKVIVLFVGLAFLHILVGLSPFFVFLAIIVDIVLFMILMKYTIDKQKVMKGIKEITAGNVEYKIPAEELKGDNRELAESINTIGQGLQNAVEESLKSERLKADLITNVSHDIKTPLTSIINYVDLLKRENIEDPKIKGYIEVLEAKAQRLKILTEDVVEASKISSGNIKLEMMDLNFVEMILQTAGEFSEKFEARDLKLISNLPDRPVLIHVDGRRLWRVLANIYNNAAKYAMEHTRIYADLEETDNAVAFSLKNVSEQALNISADELTERFIRGDISRSTEGSGLGLSIAKNLTEKMNGEFKIYLDGDLFKITLVFPKVRKQETQE